MVIERYKPEYNERLLELFGKDTTDVARLPRDNRGLEMWLANPRLDTGRDIWFAMEGDVPRGYVVINREELIARAVINFGVTRDDDIEPLFDQAVKAVGDGIRTLHVPLWSGVGAEKTVANLGFGSVRRYLRMESVAQPDGVTETPPGMELFAAVSTDFDRLADLQNGIFEGSFGYQPNSGRELAQYLDEAVRNGCLWLLGGSAGEYLGFVYGTPADDGVGWIDMVGVSPDYRGRGLGGLLTRCGLRALADRGCRKFRLEVDGANDGAVGLYKKLGFGTTASYDWWELNTHNPEIR